ncbi:hypothetical protein, variant 3 [Phytophthora nicotianae INRA-310]|uniref:CTLH domain-containing protein n=1 Tax=Phytophthora nicotianae (strain INRA-310) TaxID=761204 RepID=W2R8S1_PHYN3|nr:hypothetical protein, variant 3 [Phytophthora nicotianae INRA-310]ETN21119.1 hypothetical protein, variant 3 [Phytophthora nicotianae INRA-310]
MRRYSRDITLGSSSHRLGAAADAGFDGTPANERRFKTKRSSRRRMRISKESMNRLVMDYLVGKGYREVAEAFWRDSGTKPHVDLQSVQERMRIQQLLLKGQIQKARGKLASMDPEFLEKNSGMDFLLAKQELIELIKAHNIEEALQFAIKNLAPFGQKSPQFLHEIERTMSVIAFKNPSESPLGHLLEQAQRRRVADEVNSAILRSQKQELEPLLPSMVQQFHYMEDQLEAKLNRRSHGIRIEDSAH